jgi:hypothetical protein
VRRREIICSLGSVLTWPGAARAQQQTKISRIGYLGFGTAADYAPRVEALRAGLRELGYVEGKNVVIEFRFAERIEILRELAGELARSRVDIIFANTSTEGRAGATSDEHNRHRVRNPFGPCWHRPRGELGPTRRQYDRAGGRAIRPGHQAPGDFQGSAPARLTDGYGASACS